MYYTGNLIPYARLGDPVSSAWLPDHGTVDEKDQVAISRFEVPWFVYNHVAEAPPHKLGVMLFAPLATLQNPSTHTAQTADRIICLQSFS